MNAPTLTTIERKATPVASGDIFLVILLNEFHNIAIITKRRIQKSWYYTNENTGKFLCFNVKLSPFNVMHNWCNANRSEEGSGKGNANLNL